MADSNKKNARQFVMPQSVDAKTNAILRAGAVILPSQKEIQDSMGIPKAYVDLLMAALKPKHHP
jgi:hypothetical protein